MMLALLSNQNSDNLRSFEHLLGYILNSAYMTLWDFVYLSFLGFHTQNTIYWAFILNWFSRSLIIRYYKLQNPSQLTNSEKTLQNFGLFLFCQTLCSWLSPLDLLLLWLCSTHLPKSILNLQGLSSKGDVLSYSKLRNMSETCLTSIWHQIPIVYIGWIS